MDNLILIAPYSPLILTVLLGICLLLMQVFVSQQQSHWLSYIALLGSASLILVSSLTYALKAKLPYLPSELQSKAYSNYAFFDGTALFFYLLLSVAALLTILSASFYLEREELVKGEFYALIFFALSGMMVLVSANDLMTLFVGLEIMSMSVYILVGYQRHSTRANEAAFKYFLLGALASAFILYGIALTYGVVGSVDLTQIQSFYYHLPIGPLGSMGLLFILAGLAFKVAAVPFHTWSPDAYEGAPMPITGFMATAVKAAAFALLLKVFGEAFVGVKSYWVEVVMLLSGLTMITGNIMAMRQENIKRMLAYSSIVHTGYLLMGIAALSINQDSQIRSAILYYLFIYVISTLGVFIALNYLSAKGEKRQKIEDFAGLASQAPFAALFLALFMFSFIGIPPLGGFFAKYYLFTEAMRQGQTLLVAFAILNSILSIYYYLRVIVVMYMKPLSEAWQEKPSKPTALSMALALSGITVLWAGFAPFNLLGVLPGLTPLLEWLHIASLM